MKGIFPIDECSTMLFMSMVRWRLADFLEEKNLTAYALGKATGITRMNTIYRIARRGAEPTRVDLPTLALVLDGLQKLTGAPVSLTDVLEYVPDTLSPAEPAGDLEW
ncbi:helix-turn-helix transcriptional regulator [Deinococcus taeanensis]|uniref:helix-turn-helix domain-containing protein n=1 Tax=Deinococcus taeanensis TaxID=2737050 RepID=UPI001CDC75AA|nr:helix-turn-helix transcriptional regulator [Deinococcus taeanensis]UBV42607.1 helix-turn-helix transcriptional regulator [Deinococcus taeanensis]